MIDSLTINLPGYNHDIQCIPGITGVKHYLLKDGQVRSTGFLKNLKLTCDFKGLIIKGSLSRYLKSTNIHFLSRDEFKEAVQLLAQELGIEAKRLEGAKVWCIEIGGTLRMDHAPGLYLPLFEDLPRYKRASYRAETVRFEQKQQSLQLYDKTQEVIDKSRHSKEFCYPEMNLLRVEYKVKKRLTKLFGRELFLRDLSKKATATSLSAMIFDQFNKIVIKPLPTVHVDGAMSSREFMKAVASAGVATLGIDHLLGNMEALKPTVSRSTLHRMKVKVRESARSAAMLNPNPLVEEVRSKLEAAIKQWIFNI